MADTIDTQSIIDRVSNKASPTPEEGSEEGEAKPSGEADAHLGEAFDALKTGNRDAFISAMKSCLSY